MSVTDTLSRLVIGLGDAFVDAVAALGTEEGFDEAMAALGWTVTPRPAPVVALAVIADELSQARDDLALATAPTATQLERLRVAISTVANSLDGLSSATFPPGLTGTSFATEFGKTLVEHTLLEYLFREQRLVFHILRVLGIVRIRYVPATSDRRAHVRREILWDNASRLLSKPADAYREAFGWGTDSFDGDGLLAALQDLLCALRWPAALEPLPADLVDALSRRASGTVAPDIAVNVRLLEEAFPGGDSTAGLRILALPGSAGRLPGVAVLPFASATLARQFPVDDHLDIGLEADVDLQGGVGVRLTPDDGLSLVLGLSDPANASVGAGTLGASVDVHDPAKTEMTLVGTPGGTRFSVTTIVGRAGANVDTIGQHDFFVEVELKDAHVVLAGSEHDAFVSSTVGDNVAAGFSIAFGLSSARGAYLRGSGGLATRIPLAISIGPVRLRSLGVNLGPIPGGAALRLDTEMDVEVGPMTASIQGLGVAASVARGGSSSALGPIDGSISAVAPDGIGLTLASSVVSLSGFLSHDAATGRYAGHAHAQVATIAVDAAGILDTRPPGGGYSLACLLSAQFPGIPLFLGFTLDGIGGAVMLHRSVDVDALRAGLRNGAVQSLLFPGSSAAPETVLGALGSYFPPASGRYVLGPMARIGWDGPRIFVGDLALLFELPAPIRVVLLGAMQLGLPDLGHRVVDIRLDVLGVLDFDRETLALDASLHDSKLAGYPLSGDMALRLGWGTAPQFLFSIGGFHPHFTPPPGFPKLRRLALTAGDNPQLRLACYLALTSNTAQVGAQADLTASGAGFEIKAHVGFDALFEFVPFHFEVEITASASLSWEGIRLLGVDLDFLLSGPHPWHAKGDATFGILWWDVTVGFDVTWGDATPQALPPAPPIAQTLDDALGRDDAWAGELADSEPPWIVTGSLSTTPGTVAIHPFASLVVRERAMPLAYDITQFGNIPLGGAQRFTIPSALVGTTSTTAQPVTDAFAPGQFTRLSSDQRLAAPSFERMQAGVRLGTDEVRLGATARSSMDADTDVIDPLAPPDDPVPSVVVPAPVAATSTTVRPSRRPPRVPRRGPRVDDLAFGLASVDDLSITAEGVAVGGGIQTYAGLREALRTHAASTGLTPRLQIVPRVQVANHGVRVVVTAEDAHGRNIAFLDTVTGRAMSRSEFVDAIHAGDYPGYVVRTIHGVPTPMSRPDHRTDDNLD